MKLSVAGVEFAYERRVVFKNKGETQIFSNFSSSVRGYRCSGGETATDHCYMVIDLDVEDVSESGIYPISVKVSAGEWTEELSERITVSAGKEKLAGTVYLTLSTIFSKKPFDVVKFEFYWDEKQFDSKEISLELRSTAAVKS